MKLNTTGILLKVIRYKVHHVLFWTIYLFLLIIWYEPAVGFNKAFENALVTVLLHGSAAYFNNYYLIPYYLRQRRYSMYFASIFLSVSFICFIHIIFLFWADTIDEAEKFRLWTFEFFFNDGISVFFTLAITTALMFFKQWFEKDRLADRLEKLNAETELKYLKSQINPHFLFNSLNSVYALTLSKSDKAPEVILRLSDILRYILYDGGEKLVGLKKELEYLQNYLELEKIRYGDRLETSFEIEGETSGKEIAPMIFLPFVENSFKHGVNARIGAAFVAIKLLVKGNHLAFSIQNNRPSKNMSDSDDYQGGIGITNVKKRLNLLYHNRYSLKIEEGEIFRVTLEIDLV